VTLPDTRRPGRAAALPPDERRRAIVDAVVPLLAEHGVDVTTRQIAQAAGVAEGTLFRVFDDKDALLHAAAHAMLDPERSRKALAEVDPALSLEEVLRTAAAQLVRSSRQTMAVLMALRRTSAGPTARPDGRAGPPAFVLDASRALLEGLTELLGRYRSELRVEPERAALLLRALVMGAGQPWTTEDELITADEIAAVLLDGITTDTNGEC
jgi:AcrR family transcriptional regulator